MTTPTTTATQDHERYNRTSHILIVDDDNTLLKFFKIHLNKFFSRVLVVHNAKEAVQTLTEKEIDLVISDIRMPRTDGIQLMRRIHKLDFTIPVLLVSGALINAEQEQVINDEADGYLRKPFTVDELHQFIEQGLMRRAKVQELLALVQDKKRLKRVLSGKDEDLRLADETERARAQQLVTELKRAS